MCMSRSKHWLGFKLERFQATLHGIVYTMLSTFPTQVFISFFIRSIDIIPILSTPYYKEEVKIQLHVAMWRLIIFCIHVF